ncbi:MULTISPECIES: glycosyltransferase family 2 protein [Stenotrophomonas]|uniref:Glycosyltransferase family 2 protein n=1 Tax=Stenotrophomonas lactitubi TaxID=2045214 RepID=A0AAW4GMD4_9GAMM|nr:MULTISPECIES: glycosyltransferase family 2 protein [Stenotrophomonas]MBM9915599.1 glycosyltransferase family 2 protein [Stenotrophomonas lactitubi]MBM9922715.1 glycosyltransferase family 2 protein [Stenotrophomonas lactitubi]MBM9939345.1 glycosyltransferase family 2 protein [Stenotrophomonas lactitubi]
MSFLQTTPPSSPRIAVVIPCYKVTRHILGVISAIGPDVAAIYCVDDACPESSGDLIERQNIDPRVRVVRRVENGGVGAAVLSGYAQAVADGMDVMVKIDGDGQMDPKLLPHFVNPILRGEADYTKGNRFWDLTQIRQMPWLRRVGNLGLSFLAKASTGYWDTFDPTNGYTAIHARVAERLPVDAISKRYFFETDLLFRLNTMRAVVADVPMDAVYGDEESNLSIGKVLGEFALKHLRNLLKRVAYNYYLRDLSIASLELIAAVVLLMGGSVYGGWHWWQAASHQVPSPVGTVVLPAIALVSGLQFLLAFIGYDIAAVPRRALHDALQPK